MDGVCDEVQLGVVSLTPAEGLDVFGTRSGDTSDNRTHNNEHKHQEEQNNAEHNRAANVLAGLAEAAHAEGAHQDGCEGADQEHSKGTLSEGLDLNRDVTQVSVEDGGTRLVDDTLNCHDETEDDQQY